MWEEARLEGGKIIISAVIRGERKSAIVRDPPPVP